MINLNVILSFVIITPKNSIFTVIKLTPGCLAWIINGGCLIRSEVIISDPNIITNLIYLLSNSQHFSGLILPFSLSQTMGDQGSLKPWVDCPDPYRAKPISDF